MTATEREKVQALLERLVEERRRVVDAASEGDGLPAAGFLGRLSSLDGTTAAVEAMLERLAEHEAQDGSARGR